MFLININRRVWFRRAASRLCCFFPCWDAVLKRTKKSKNDLINAEEGEDHFTDIPSAGETPDLFLPDAHTVFEGNTVVHTTIRDDAVLLDCDRLSDV